ncbi:MAG: CPBP family intramembrane glutamic endopeptidase [Sphingopyxis sp.]
MVAKIILGDAGLLSPGRWRWGRALLWLCLLAAVCIVAFNVAADASLHVLAMAVGEEFTTRAAAPPGARLIAVCIGSMAMLGTYALAIHIVERRSTPEIGLRSMVPDMASGIALGGALMATIIGLLWCVDWVVITPKPVTHMVESLKQTIQSAVIEEVLVRIIVFRLLWRATGVFPALILTALLFGGLHLSNPDASVFSSLCLVAGEGIGAGLYMITGRVWMAIGMHAGWNFAQGWVFGSAVSGLDVFAGGPLQTTPVDGVAVILSGGGFGPESSIIALFVSLIASGLFLGIAWRKGRFAAITVD